MIALKNISKRYSKNKVLNSISVDIPEKSITGIIGPNGAGKSTLIRIITGFEFPDTGTVYIKNNEMRNFYQRKEYLSYMPENMSIYPEYSVDEFLSFYHLSAYLKNDDLLKTLSLKKIFNKRIKNLSKGWHQRLKLYTALCNPKSIVVLDEPFDGFDPLQMKEIINLFKSQNSDGRSFILSIHQLTDAQKICDYFIFLDNGYVIAEGTLDELGNHFSCETYSLEDIFLKALEK